MANLLVILSIILSIVVLIRFSILEDKINSLLKNKHNTNILNEDKDWPPYLDLPKPKH